MKLECLNRLKYKMLYHSIRSYVHWIILASQWMLFLTYPWIFHWRPCVSRNLQSFLAIKNCMLYQKKFVNFTCRSDNFFEPMLQFRKRTPSRLKHRHQSLKRDQLKIKFSEDTMKNRNICYANFNQDFTFQYQPQWVNHCLRLQCTLLQMGVVTLHHF
mgnify:CR=1 FL=1